MEWWLGMTDGISNYYLVRLEPREIVILSNFFHREFGRVIDARKAPGEILRKIIGTILEKAGEEIFLREKNG
jgi:hypothetical protein